jgi:hypothetical protein
VLARVPKASAEMVAAAICTIFAQPTGAEAIEQLDKVAAMLASEFPAVASMLVEPVRTGPPSPPSRSPTGASCGAPTPWSG